tara:strand:+ start:46 stop:819 length:774 start_codon:yes stop_codon:yes gene_type:complete
MLAAALVTATAVAASGIFLLGRRFGVARTFCSIVAGAMLLALWLVYPVVFMSGTTTMVSLKAFGEWTCTGSGAGVPAQLNGTYYLEGNVVGSGELSPLFMIDASHATVTDRSMHFHLSKPGAFAAIAEGDRGKSALFEWKLLRATRFNYAFDWNAPFSSANVVVYLGAIKTTTGALGKPAGAYYWTIDDVHSDGSVLLRKSYGSESMVHHDAADWEKYAATYRAVRLVDCRTGEVDEAVAARMLETWRGSMVIMNSS